MLELLTWENFAALLTLTGIEIALGIDNILFLSIVTAKLPPAKQPAARIVGLMGALVMRLALLWALSWVMGLTKPWFGIAGHEFSGKSLILLLGGLFLIWKGTREIHHKLEEPGEPGLAKAATSFAGAVLQITLIDIVFSLDSVITAVGMTPHKEIIAAAIVISVAVMIVFAGAISRIIDRHPSLKVLALAFVILIGVFLVAEGMGQHIEKGYIYFAMGFALVVELVNLRVSRAPAKPH